MGAVRDPVLDKLEMDAAIEEPGEKVLFLFLHSLSSKMVKAIDWRLVCHWVAATPKKTIRK